MGLFTLVYHDPTTDNGESYAMYATIEEALDQGTHDLAMGVPALCVRDETGIEVAQVTL